jgi:2,3-dihydroxybenzoate decarboxylase
MTERIAPAAGYRRIATEEAFIPPELHRMYLDLIASGGIDDPGFNSLMGYYLTSQSERARNVSERLKDLGSRRLADMDAAGIDMQILSLTSPGVQVLKPDVAVAMARLANDQLAEAIRRHPTRFAGLIAIAPQNPEEAVREMERGATKLGLKGVIVNSHTQGEYLDNPRFWPIFEAAEALGLPIYLHPNTPPPKMIAPFLESGLDGAIYGFAVETGLHMLRIVTQGIFDRYPKLTMVVGHLGEALPFWLFRLDYMHRGTVNSKRYDFMKPLQKKVSDYLRDNFYYTTAGMPWEPAIQFTQRVIGMERVMYAMDYPYQYVPEEVLAQDALPISDAEKKAFYQTIAERVFKL